VLGRAHDASGQELPKLSLIQDTGNAGKEPHRVKLVWVRGSVVYYVQRNVFEAGPRCVPRWDLVQVVSLGVWMISTLALRAGPLGGEGQRRCGNGIGCPVEASQACSQSSP